MIKPFISMGLFVFAVCPLFAQTRIISHVTAADGGFATSVVLENSAVTAQTVTLVPYSQTGERGEAVAVDVPAQGVYRSEAHALLGASASHFSVEGSADVKANVYYDYASGNASPAFVGESSDQGAIWRLFPGNWDKVFDGVAVVNTGSAATDIWIAQKDDAGNVLAAQQLATALAPNAKALYIVGSPTVHTFENVPSYFEISGDQNLALTALQGTLENDTLNILLGTETRAVGHSTSARDDKGVWFIEDGSLYDVFEMMGYNVTFDRLWQLDVFRRQARGTLSEIISPSIVPTIVDIDTFARQRDFSDAELDAFFDAMDAESQILVRAYITGINRRIAQVNADAELLPVEYKALGETTIPAWTHRDLMSHLASFQTRFSMRSFGAEQVLNAALLQELEAKYGAEQAAVMFNDQRYVSDPQSQTMIENTPVKSSFSKAAQPLAFLRDDLVDLRAGAHAYAERIQSINSTMEKYGFLIKGGSYAWVVDGSKTASGNPILYSGPQVGFTAPVLFVEGSVRCDAFTASGMTIPGIPAIIVGRTPHHAWSMQVGYGETWDYYLEDEADVTVVRQETVKVKGGDDVIVDIEHSAHGPIMADLGGAKLAFKYSHRNYNFELAKGLLNLSRAESMDAFGEAVDNLAVSQHLCYADRDGNIAYWHSGRQPVRPDGDWRVPQGVLAGQPILEWDAAVVHPREHERNPVKGYFGGWNNKPSPDFIDYSATTALGPYHRGHAVRDFLESFDPENKWTFEDLQDLAINIGATNKFAAGGNPWVRLGDAVVNAVAGDPTPERTAAMALFDGWDGHAVAGGPSQWVAGSDIHDASVLLDAMIPRLIEATFFDEMGTPTGDQDMITRFQVLLHGLYPEGLNNSYDWFTNLEDAGAPQTRDGVILSVLDGLLAELGPNPWGIDAREGITYPHVLFGPITDLGIVTPTPAGNRATYAQCVEYGSQGPVRIESFFALGQSGTITGTLFAPIFDEDALSMKGTFDDFVMRSFPLFP